MNSADQHFNSLYEQHLTNLKLQGKRPTKIDAYSRAVRLIIHCFDRSPDTLSSDYLKTFFANLIESHSWSTDKLDMACVGITKPTCPIYRDKLQI
ncbi:hypothetical protein A9264_07230 [Vibrio sp. UCD-FRSSP16_10]|nr:hypothetical protein A9264_07230 [Vibrio sp. UCD-FRSSP16_10]OBT17960.1 hypothetical protein A9260_01220 [Vibrio sp. UCD-FRSSP16_30]